MLRFLTCGQWTPQQLAIHWIPSSRRALPEVETNIDSAWNTAMARPGVHLFDGPMCRLESWTASSDQLELTLSQTSYKLFVGTNMANPQFADRFGTDVMANPLGVSPALLTADHQLLLGQRTSAVAYHPNRVHPFAGCMEPGDDDPFATVYRELHEELSINQSEITDLHCIGLVEGNDLRQPEIIFAATTRLKKSEIESRVDPTEHHSIWAIPSTAEAIESAVTTDKNLTPVAVAALLLWGRINIGQAWFEAIARQVAPPTK
jgi:8-oxo-dGTP pyrophosphatase MutT (NUDIX family)